MHGILIAVGRRELEDGKVHFVSLSVDSARFGC
jgi:hypothetical protein